MSVNSSNIIIGIDLDNTIINYGNIFAERAASLGYINSNLKSSKNEVKKNIKNLLDGEKKWGILQSEVYGEGINKAIMMEGFSDFVKKCRECKILLYIISHKSINNPYDPISRNIQKPALDWMAANSFFKKEALGFNQKQVFFAETMNQKVELIKELNCSHFIDDLLDVLLHPNFPGNTTKFQLIENSHFNNIPGVDYRGNWHNITDYFIREEGLYAI